MKFEALGLSVVLTVAGLLEFDQNPAIGCLAIFFGFALGAYAMESKHNR